MTRSTKPWWGAIALGVWLTSCHTVTTVKRSELPREFLQLFTTCGPADGTVALTFRRDQTWLAQVDIDWVAGKHGEWISELSGYLGQPLLRVQYHADRSDVQITGRMRSRLPDFGVDDDGFLSADGFLVALGLKEIPCLLQAKLPRLWLRNLRSVESRRGVTSYNFRQSGRRIVVKQVASNPKGFCAELRWRTHMWLVGHQLTYCHSPGAAVENEVTGYEDIRIQWKVLP